MTCTAMRDIAMGKNVTPYFGVVGDRNLGDEALYGIAESSFPTLELTPIRSTRLLQRSLLRKCVNLKRCLLIGGGTLLLSEPLRTALEPLVKAGMATATFGTGAMDPVYWGKLNEDQKQAWVACLSTSVGLGVRGPRTKALLNDLGIASASIVGDPAVVLTRPSYRGPSGEKVLGVNFGTSHREVWGGDEVRPRRELACALRELQRRGWEVRLFCVWPMDIKAITALADEAGINKKMIVKEYVSAKRMMEEISQCRIFIGMKLHAIALAVCSSVASMALEYRPKIRDYMESINAGDDVMRFDAVHSETLIETIIKMGDDVESISHRQWRASRQLAVQFRQYVLTLRGVLSEQ